MNTDTGEISGKRNYRPNFTIFTGEKRGVLLNTLRGDPDYDRKEKRNQNWKLLEFSPNDLKGSGVFYTLLKQKLEFSVRTQQEEIWDRIKDRAIDSFTKATVGFINRCRKLSLTAGQLSDRVNTTFGTKKLRDVS